MPFFGFLLRLCVLAFVLAGVVLEVVEWNARRYAIRRLLAGIPEAPQVDRPRFETPTLAPLGRIAPGASRDAVLEQAEGQLSARFGRPSRSSHPTG
jgi:hypothetical protein